MTPMDPQLIIFALECHVIYSLVSSSFSQSQVYFDTLNGMFVPNEMKRYLLTFFCNE